MNKMIFMSGNLDNLYVLLLIVFFLLIAIFLKIFYSNLVNSASPESEKTDTLGSLDSAKEEAKLEESEVKLHEEKTEESGFQSDYAFDTGVSKTEVKGVETESVKTDRFEVIKQELVKPENFESLVDYLSSKYMLLNLTIATMEGLPVASNSDSPEMDSAIAPEILRLVGNIVDSDKITVSGKDTKILVFNINEELLGFSRVVRDLSAMEIEMLKREILNFVEGGMEA